MTAVDYQSAALYPNTDMMPEHPMADIRPDSLSQPCAVAPPPPRKKAQKMPRELRPAAAPIPLEIAPKAPPSLFPERPRTVAPPPPPPQRQAQNLISGNSEIPALQREVAPPPPPQRQAQNLVSGNSEIPALQREVAPPPPPRHRTMDTAPPPPPPPPPPVERVGAPPACTRPPSRNGFLGEGIGPLHEASEIEYIARRDDERTASPENVSMEISHEDKLREKEVRASSELSAPLTEEDSLYARVSASCGTREMQCCETLQQETSLGQDEIPVQSDESRVSPQVDMPASTCTLSEESPSIHVISPVVDIEIDASVQPESSHSEVQSWDLEEPMPKESTDMEQLSDGKHIGGEALSTETVQAEDATLSYMTEPSGSSGTEVWSETVQLQDFAFIPRTDGKRMQPVDDSASEETTFDVHMDSREVPVTKLTQALTVQLGSFLPVSGSGDELTLEGQLENNGDIPESHEDDEEIVQFVSATLPPSTENSEMVPDVAPPPPTPPKKAGGELDAALLTEQTDEDAPQLELAPPPPPRPPPRSQAAVIDQSEVFASVTEGLEAPVAERNLVPDCDDELTPEGQLENNEDILEALEDDEEIVQFVSAALPNSRLSPSTENIEMLPDVAPPPPIDVEPPPPPKKAGRELDAAFPTEQTNEDTPQLELAPPPPPRPPPRSQAAVSSCAYTDLSDIAPPPPPRVPTENLKEDRSPPLTPLPPPRPPPRSQVVSSCPFMDVRLKDTPAPPPNQREMLSDSPAKSASAAQVDYVAPSPPPKPPPAHQTFNNAWPDRPAVVAQASSSSSVPAELPRDDRSTPEATPEIWNSTGESEQEQMNSDAAAPAREPVRSPANESRRAESRWSPQPQASLQGWALFDANSITKSEHRRGGNHYVEINLSRQRLDDEKIKLWCDWAAQAFPRLGVVCASNEKVSKHYLSLNFAENNITDAGMETLCHFLSTRATGVRLRQLRLHKNKLTEGSGLSVARLLGVLGANAGTEYRGALEELHLSHNKLGKRGIMMILNAVATAWAEHKEFPLYPLKIPGRDGKFWYKPLWLRIEYNGQEQKPPEVFIAEVTPALREKREQRGWLERDSPAAILCEGRFKHGCSLDWCSQQYGEAGPVLHLTCWGGDYREPSGQHKQCSYASYRQGYSSYGRASSSSQYAPNQYDSSSRYQQHPVYQQQHQQYQSGPRQQLGLQNNQSQQGFNYRSTSGAHWQPHQGYHDRPWNVTDRQEATWASEPSDRFPPLPRGPPPSRREYPRAEDSTVFGV